MYEELVKQLRDVGEEVCNDYDVDPYNAEQRSFVIEQAADAIEELNTNYDAATDIMVRQTAYIEELEKKIPRWISVEERLPVQYDDVLLLFQHNQAAGFWDGDCWCVYSGDCFYTEVAENEDKPTRWANKLPLPEPPKEDA